MLKEIADFCQQYDMLPPGVNVVACVSGGVDSMCLLDALERLLGDVGFRLYAAHFNHNLRGAESDGDEAFVREQCERRGIRLFTGSGDVKGEAVRRGKGIEETARDMRYAFFEDVRRELGSARIATAHNSDDNLETVLMRIARGTGLRGLCGIPPVSGNIIRPILFATRARIEAYCRENGVPHREDSTNALDEYTRNLLRHRAVPVLKELNPALNVAGMTRLLRGDEEFLQSLAADFLREHSVDGGVPADKLASLPYPVASRAVRALFGERLGEAHVDAILSLAKSADPSGEVNVPGATVRREYGLLTSRDTDAAGFPETRIPLDRAVIIGDIRLKFTVEPYERGGIYNSLTIFLIKRDKIKAGILARPRKTGDELRLRGGRKTVKRLMIDRKIPARSRGSIPVIVSGGEVLAVYGVGQSIDTLPAKGEPAVILKIEKAEG